MSLNLGVMSAAVTLDDHDYRNKLAGLEGASQSSFSKIAAYAASYLSLRAISQFATSTIRTFSDLEEETNKFNVVFAGLGNQTSAILKQMREEFGLSELAAKRMLAGTGDILTGFGFDRDTALALSEGAAKLGADIASFSNYAGGASGATNALTKAMLGETESAKMLGVVIRQDSDEYKDLIKQAMSTGITIDALGKTFKVSSEQQAKAVAALALAYQQSPNAIGDFKRSSDSISNQQRILQNNFEQLTATIGGDLAPAYQSLITTSNSLLTSYNNLSPTARKFTNDIVLLSAALLVLNKTKIGENIKNFFSNISSSDDAKIALMQEEEKRAEIEKTDAVYEAVYARQKMRLAQNAKEEAAAALASIQATKAVAEAKGDTAGVAAAAAAELKARATLTKATIDAANAEKEYHAKHTAATAATQRHAAVSSQLASILPGVASATRLTGVAALFSSGGFQKAALAIKSFFVSIGPIGWALLAAGVAFEAASLAVNSYNEKLEKNAKLAADAASEADELADKNNATTKASFDNLERLQELAQYERLNNEEREEATRLLKEEGIAYEDTGRNIEEMIRLKNGEAVTLGDLAKKRKEELKQQRLAILENQILAKQFAIEQNEKRRHGTWGAFFEGIFDPNDTSVQERDDEINKQNAIYRNDIQIIRDEINGLKNDEANLGKTQAERAKKNAEAAKRQRQLIKSIEKSEFDADFDVANSEKKIKMINAEINRIFKRQSGKYKNVDDFMSADLSTLSEKELLDTQKIVELEKKREEIKKRSADYFKREQQDYKKYLEDRNREQRNRRIENEIKKKQNLGDETGITAIMNRELERARKAAAEMKRQYENAKKNAQKDGISTKEEEKQIALLRSRMERAFSDQDRWQSRVDDRRIKEQGMRDSVSAWTLEALSAKLGANTPEKEIARNTKRTNEILLRMENSTSSGNSSGNYS